MKDFTPALQKAIDHNAIETTNFDKFLEGMKGLYDKHVIVNEKMRDLAKEANLNVNAIYEKCPCCGSKTMLSFGTCHVCGTGLYEVEGAEVTKPKATVEAKEDDDTDKEAKEEKTKKAKKKTSKKAKKNTKTTPKKEEKKEEKKAKKEEDDDLSFLDDDDETPKKEEKKEEKSD